jgi:hypothetical protein
VAKLFRPCDDLSILVQRAGGLLSSSPLARAQKVGAVLTDLACLAVAATQQQAQDAAGKQQAEQGSQQAAAALLGEWLSFAAQHFQSSIGADEKASIVAAWPGALLEAASAEKLTGREQQVAGRRLKKLIREFAELHSRTQ